MSNLLKRSLSGLLFVAILLGATIAHPIAFALLFGGILYVTQTEFYIMTEQTGIQAQKHLGRILGLLFYFLCFLTAGKLLPSQYFLLCIPLLMTVFIAELFKTKNSSVKNSALTLLGLIYIALPFSLLNFIVYSGSPENKTFYPWILVGIFFIIWVYDSMAYVFGSLLGKHKIAVNISPGKSWEGLIGGTVFALIMGVVNAVLFSEIDMMNWLVIALLVVIFGTMGDFFESKIKRETGIKDSGNILPGHGGLLDRFDSLLFAAPVIFVWLNFIDNF